MSCKRALNDEKETQEAKRLKLEVEEPRQATFKDLPVEIIWKIIEYLNDDTVFRLLQVNEFFSKALSLAFSHNLNSIPNNIILVRRVLYEKLKKFADIESKRVKISKALIQLVWIESEVTCLEGIIKRYCVDSTNPLFTALWPILKEVLDAIQSLKESDQEYRWSPLVYLPRWSRFIITFDKEVEPRLSPSTPFEIRVVDILTCCLTANITVQLKRSRDGTHCVGAYFQIQDSITESLIKRMEAEPPEKEKGNILSLLRNMVRKRNSNHLSSIFNDMVKLEDQCAAELETKCTRVASFERHEATLRNLYSPLVSVEDFNGSSKSFMRQCTYDVPSNFMECSLERDNLQVSQIPLIALYPAIFNIETNQNVENIAGPSFEVLEKSDSSFNLKWSSTD